MIVRWSPDVNADQCCCSFVLSVDFSLHIFGHYHNTYCRIYYSCNINSFKWATQIVKNTRKGLFLFLTCLFRVDCHDDDGDVACASGRGGDCRRLWGRHRRCRQRRGESRRACRRPGRQGSRNQLTCHTVSAQGLPVPCKPVLEQVMYSFILESYRHWLVPPKWFDKTR